jgi:AmmeMemoRadiSam system protein A
MSSSKKSAGTDLGLTELEKKELHKIARSVIQAKTRGEPVPYFTPATERLNEKRGAFVCIYKKGMLRGCIGTLEARDPMYKAVQEMAEASAFRDPRFRPVTEDELPYLEIEISILTPFRQIKDPADVQVGPHGLVVRKGFQSGLLLPQVAAERNWDRVTFLEETCRKAGLMRDAWKDPDTELYVFSADVF